MAWNISYHRFRFRTWSTQQSKGLHSHVSSGPVGSAYALHACIPGRPAWALAKPSDRSHTTLQASSCLSEGIVACFVCQRALSSPCEPPRFWRECGARFPAMSRHAVLTPRAESEASPLYSSKSHLVPRGVTYEDLAGAPAAEVALTSMCRRDRRAPDLPESCRLRIRGLVCAIRPSKVATPAH